MRISYDKVKIDKSLQNSKPRLCDGSDETINHVIRGSLNNFPGFFRMGTFIDSTQMKL